MGFQSRLLATGGAIAGAIGQVGKEINTRNELLAKQKAAIQKTKQAKEAKTEQRKRRDFSKYVPTLLEEGSLKMSKDQMKSLTSQYTKT